jgi:excisionase family DNA binding protein
MVQAMATKLLSVSDAAEYLGVSATSLRRWTNAGKLHAKRLPGGARRYDVAEVDRFAHAMEEAGTPSDGSVGEA